MDEIEQTFADLPKTKQDLAVAVAERKIIHTQYIDIRDKYDAATRPDDAPPSLAGVTGKIIAVDPKWDFVVLDVGLNHGVRQRGEMVVSRDGKLITRLKIASVKPNYSIANILQSWKQAEAVEGDAVVGQ